MSVDPKSQKTASHTSFGKAWGYVLSHFRMAANQDGRMSFNKAYDQLVQTIAEQTRDGLPLDQSEPQIRRAFTDFLKSQNYHFALKNFEQLLREKSGPKFQRNDGTTNWFHELIPTLTIMATVRTGKVSMKAMDREGGLETVIATHLRHDSVEDQQEYTMNKTAFRSELLGMVLEISQEHPAYDVEKGFAQAEQTIINTGLITQNKSLNAEGVKVKEDVVDYTHRLVSSPNANPPTFMNKQVDGIHNFATMWAPKFTPERRLKRCNEREDMYGPRYGFPDRAMEKWPDFAGGIKVLDDMMGFMLYTHFRYLESVDLYYKVPRDIPVGINRYIKGAMAIDLPEEANMMHIFMKNMMRSVDPAKDPEKHQRLQHFIEVNIKPVLEPYREKFPYLFKNDDRAPNNAPAPVAL